MLAFVYKILPAFVHYDDSMVPDGFGGVARGPSIYIRKKYEGSDRGILEHELTHVRQFWRRIWFALIKQDHGTLYDNNFDYRLAAEVEAYKKQIAIYREDNDPRAGYTRLFATYIALKYGLGISIDEAEGLLLKV